MAVLVFTIAVLTFGIFPFVSTDRGPVPEEYAVWSALVDDLLASRGSPPAGARVLIEQTTESVDRKTAIVPLQLLSLGTEREIRDFLTKNRQPWLLQEGFNLQRKYTLVDRSAVRQFLLCQYRTCPNTLIGANASAAISVSRVGFDMWHHHAVLEFSYLCGQRCGRSGYATLRKQDGRWMLEHFSQSWIPAPSADDPAKSLPSSPYPDVR
jgi:hypothetical protein